MFKVDFKSLMLFDTILFPDHSDHRVKHKNEGASQKII
jgi:hypothetical protein